MRYHILYRHPDANIRIMLADEASFGRISEPKACWCPPGTRPTVPNHRVREYVYAFGAIDPISGDDFFIVAPKCNTDWTNELRMAFEKPAMAFYHTLKTGPCSDKRGRFFN